MRIHETQPRTSLPKARRVGRGGKRGKTSGRGSKGQKARAGHHIRPNIRDIIKKLPKLRGHGKNRARTVNDSVVKPQAVNVAMLEKNFDAGTRITPSVLLEKSLVRRVKGRAPEVKILGTGEVTKKFTVANCLFSESAKEKIESAGGTIIKAGA